MMIGLGQVQDFCAVAGAIKDATALSDLMAEITKAMGFRHYALVHHVDLKPAVRSVHIVDYPQDWVERFQARRLRSEVHTSELQSLMRISYAVFCSKKQT